MAGHLLQLKPPGSCWSLGSGTPTRTKTHCAILGKKSSILITHLKELRLGGNLSTRRGFDLGFRVPPVVVVAAAAEGGMTSESDVVVPEPSEENCSFPAEFQDLSVHRRDPPNLFLYAAGFCVIVLMRDVIFREFAGWGINFGRIALYIADGLAIGLGELTNVLAEPIAILMSVLSWAIMAVTDIYWLIVDAAPVKSLLSSLVLSLAVLSIGDAATCRVQGPRTRLLGVATAIGLAGVLEFIPPEAVLWCLMLLTAFAKLVQKADLVTMFMPATVTLVAISEPVLRAAVFAAFMAVSVYANWRFRAQEGEATPSEVQARAGKRVSVVFSIISVSICISLAARMLYFRSVKWLVLRST